MNKKLILLSMLELFFAMLLAFWIYGQGKKDGRELLKRELGLGPRPLLSFKVPINLTNLSTNWVR